MSSSPSSTPRWPWVIVVVLVAAAGWWLFGQRDAPQSAPDTDAATAAQPQGPAASTPPAGSQPQAAPAIQHPVPGDAADAALPALAASDDAAWQALSGAFGNDAALGIVLREHLIQRLVVMIDNLTQPSLTRNALAVKPVEGTLQVREGETAMEIDPANAQRYAPYVAAFTHADPATLVQAYRRFYPLFQQAYLELGKPNAYFNDRLVEVIDHLLQAPDPSGPLSVEPDGKGRLRFTDPALERLSVGQKALVRLGPQQEAAVKQQLRAIRTALTRMD